MSERIHSSIITEDDISEAILLKIIHIANPYIIVDDSLGKRGDQFIKQNLNGYYNASRQYLYIILNDLDRSYNCAPEKIRDWLNRPPRNNFIFRIAVHEVESWILADRRGIASYLKIPLNSIPYHPESLPDPKQSLIQLARHSRSRQIRTDILPPPNSNAEHGRGYNSCLTKFIHNNWNLNEAIDSSDSLERAYNRIASYRP